MGTATVGLRSLVAAAAAALVVVGAVRAAPAFTTYGDLQDYCVRRASVLATDELNRSLAEVTLQRGAPPDLAGRTPQEVIAELRKQGYYRSLSPFRFEWDPVELADGRFRSRRFGLLSPGEYPATAEVPWRFLRQALIDRDPRVRWFALDHLVARPDIAPVESVLEGFLRFPRGELAGRWLELLRSERYVKAAPRVPALGPAGTARVKALAAAARTRPEKAQALFLAAQFTAYRPELEVPTLVQLFDDGYPVAFMTRLFKAYPPRWLHEFIVPYVEGYGDRQPTLLAVFMAFPDDPLILGAIQYSFVNRRVRHFAVFQEEILRAVERLTGLAFVRDDASFVEWFKAHGAVVPAVGGDEGR